MATTKLLFVHGAGPGAYEEDRPLASHVQSTQADRNRFSYPRIVGLERFNWSKTKTEISEALAGLDDGATVVAHSAGGAAVLKVLGSQPELARLRALHLVAIPYMVADGEWGEEESALEIDFARRLPKIDSIRLYHSRDDEIIPFAHLSRYGEKLPQADCIELDGFGHQFSSKRCRELLDAIAHEA